MAIDKLRLRVKTADGYNAAHLETSADLVVGLTEAIDGRIDTQVPKDLNGFTNNAGYAKTSEMNAALASKLANTATGSATKGIYINSSGDPAAMTYSVNKDVPADAKFTDTTYTPASAAPLVDGTAAVGTSTKYAREDHVHPTDTTRASAADVLALYEETKTTKELVAGLDSAIMYRSASGNLAAFSDGCAANVHKLAVTLAPTQNGSGDPYLPGGGRNLLPLTLASMKESTAGGTWNENVYTTSGVAFTVNLDDNGNVTGITANGTAGSADAYFRFITGGLPLTPGTSYTLSGCPSGGGSSSYCVYTGTYSSQGWYDIGAGATKSYNAEWSNLFIKINAGYTVNNIVFRPMVRRASDTDPTFAPYSNIRPISGVSSVAVTRTGPNLWGGSKMLADISAAIPSATVNGTSITYSGSSASNKIFIPGIFRENARYTLALNFSTTNITPAGINIAFNYADGSYDRIIAQEASGTVWQTSASGKTVVSIGGNWNGGTTTIETALSGVFEGVASASDFAPYQGQSVSVTLVDGNNTPLTVYGGTLDVTTGTLTVTHAAVDLGTLNWGKNAAVSAPYFYTTGLAFVAAIPASNDIPANALCSHYPVATLNNVYFNKVSAGIAIQTTPSAGYVTLRDNSKADYSAEDFAATLSGATFVYPLKTPVTHTLTPRQLAALAGYNIVYADCGTVDVTYRADPALAYANLESSITAAILSLGAGI